MIAFLRENTNEIFIAYEMVLLLMWFILLLLSIWVTAHTTRRIPWWYFTLMFGVLMFRRVAFITYHLAWIDPSAWNNEIALLDNYGVPMILALILLAFFCRLVRYIKLKGSESIVKGLSDYKGMMRRDDG